MACPGGQPRCDVNYVPPPPTPTPIPTETPIPTNTPVVTDTPTATATPTYTPTPEKTELELALERAWAGVESNADWQPFTQEFDGVEMVLVPVGSFEMGSTEQEIDLAVQLCNEARQDGDECLRSFFEDEKPAHMQAFSQPFWIDRTEVTRAQYQACVDAGVCEEIPDSDFSTEDDQPINRVTWFQAQTYCEWREGRLPTEAEWEYAARGPDRLLFAWGNTFDESLSNFCDSNCADAGWSEGYTYLNPQYNDGYEVTAPVGSFPGGASWVGALDLSGNLWEWTSSLYEDYPYRDDHESNSDTSSARVLRGGSFIDAASFLRSADRVGVISGGGGNFVGFRCARSY